MQGNNIIRFKIEDKQKLYQVYMPFVKDGGIFFPTTKKYNMGDELFVLLELPEDKTPRPLATRVVWISTSNMPDRPIGIGLQFMNTAQSDPVRAQIEQLLMAVVSDKPTFTL